MRFTQLIPAVLVVLAAAPAALAGNASDPAGDTFGTGGAAIDVTSFAANSTSGELVLDLAFNGEIAAPNSGAGNALTGFIDLDVDGDAATGQMPFVDFLTGLETGTGSDFYVDLQSYDAADGQVDVMRSGGVTAGRVPMSISGSSLGVRIPLAVLADDGAVRSAAVVGTSAEATDAVPNGGFVESAASGESVLVNGGRFSVEVGWKDFAGTTGTGRLSVRSEDTAVFYFFSEDNWELMVKVLDGCGINERFWVFAAATTTVEYTLTVTDTQTSTVKQYFNPLGTASAAVNDTEAFTDCP